MTDATWVVQISPKLPDGTLINVRADSPEQLDTLLSYLEGKGADITSFVQSLTAQGNVAAAFPGSQNVQNPVQQYQQAAAAPPPTWAQQGSQQQSGPPAPNCQHGPMVLRSGEKNGRTWSGYFCPTPKGTPGQCDPQFNKG